ncbi:LTA synthase family protein [Ruminococcus sp. OA3]|nr:LTA synthase family protein [Ruminococcus sp. OA3]MCH1984291.1 LTA synthase family protein [Ruminococcus sp. OA3]
MKNFKVNWGKVVKVCNWFSVPLQFLGVCILYLIVEAICRHSLYDAVQFMTGSKLVFLYNAFLIFVTTTVVYLTRRRIFARTVIFVVWLILGIINGVVLACRVTPFTGPDLKLITESLRILNKYLSLAMLIIVLALLVLLICGLVWLAVKAPKYQGKMYYRLNIPLVLAGIGAFVMVTNVALEKRVLSSYFGNIAFAYEDYGFPYCLGTTFFNVGINCPNGYGEDLMHEIVQSEGTIERTRLSEPATNIIFLQLESFFDPELVEFLNISEDPIPNFRRLMKEYTSGYFKVPSVGAGTANTEFEAITGMSLHYFGPGEYPYKTILKEKTCESIPYVLKGLGYSTHAIHNNEANFYSRKSVFANLGFETFTSEEYMPDISDTTETGWVKDHILTDEIMKCLESTDSADYIYTISVQGHGDYPAEPILEDPQITVTGAEKQEKNNNSWEYYVNQLKEMDDFIQELVETLEDYDEPVVLVMYGDHLPTMGLTAEDVENRYLFQTEYVMWDNIGLEKKDVNLAAYQMGAEVLDRLNIHEGTIVNYHQNRRKTQNYQVDLEAMQYDILYGEQYVYQGQDPFMRTKLKLGAVPVVFSGITKLSDGTYYITGENFTASSKLEINEDLIEDTYFIGPNTLMVREVEITDGDVLDVAQQSNSSTHRVLSRTGTITYEEPKTTGTLPPEEEQP